MAVRLNEQQKEMTEQYFALAYHVARRLKLRGASPCLDDLAQIAAVAIAEASTRFDPSRGVLWKTYAYRCAYLVLIRHLQCDGVIRIAPHPRWEKGSDPQEEINRRRTLKQLTIDIEARKGPDVDAEEQEAFRRKILTRALSRLSRIQADVIQRRFFQNMTLQDIGNNLKLSKERIRQIQAEAIAKLQKFLKRYEHEI